MNLKQEATVATDLLKGKIVARIYRHREKEILVEFEDGTRLFVDQTPNGVEISIEGNDEKT